MRHFLRDSFDFWQRKIMFEIVQFWQEMSKRLGSIFEQWTKLHFKLNLEWTLMHEPLVCKWTERISLSLCTWSQMVKSLLPIFLLSYITYSFLWYMYNFIGCLWCPSEIKKKSKQAKADPKPHNQVKWGWKNKINYWTFHVTKNWIQICRL